jgi:hypothetical protein
MIKRSRRDRLHRQTVLHLVCAWSAPNRLVFGQIAVSAAANAMTGTPELPDLLVRHDCAVIIDAINCQATIAATIRERCSVSLHRFSCALRRDSGCQAVVPGHVERDGRADGRWRIETRRCVPSAIWR